jgi:hypothetical protein
MTGIERPYSRPIWIDSLQRRACSQLAIPPLSEERRQELIKLVKKMLESRR